LSQEAEAASGCPEEEMQIRVVREQYRPGCTVGRMFVDGAFECFTLEDGIRTNKVYGDVHVFAPHVGHGSAVAIDRDGLEAD
jgi:hypothetical protein